MVRLEPPVVGQLVYGDCIKVSTWNLNKSLSCTKCGSGDWSLDLPKLMVWLGHIATVLATHRHPRCKLRGFLRRCCHAHRGGWSTSPVNGHRRGGRRHCRADRAIGRDKRKTQEAGLVGWVGGPHAPIYFSTVRNEI